MKNSYHNMSNGVTLSFDEAWKSAEELIASAKTMQQMKELDKDAIENKGIPSVWLMENAARAVVEEVIALTDNDAKAKICIVCGAGNNGGDGVACAYMLMNRGYTVSVYLCGKEAKMTADEKVMEERLIAEGGELVKLFDREPIDYSQISTDISEADCVVDALFGVGIARSIEGSYAEIINIINRAAKVVSCDIPSGVNGDTGDIMGVAVKADVTVTFSYIKQGLLSKAATDNIGLLKVVPIGLPDC